MVRFARCNALLSLALDANGKGCRYVAKGDTDDLVLKDMNEHLQSIQADDWERRAEEHGDAHDPGRAAEVLAQLHSPTLEP